MRFRFQPALPRVFSLVALCAATAAGAAPYAAGVRHALGPSDYSSHGISRARLRVADDLNGDGRPDILAASPRGAVLALLSNPSSRALEARIAAPAATSAFASGDFDRDGTIDVVVAGAASFTLFTGDGSGGFTASTSVNLDVLGPHAGVEDLVAGDFDQDGRPDVAVIDADPLNNFRTFSNGSGGLGFHRNSVAIAYGLGNGSFDTTRPRIGTVAYPQQLAAVDFERDGRPELIAAGAESKTVQVLCNNATNPLGSQSTSLLLPAASEQAELIDIAAGHLDADNKLDLAVLFYTHLPPGTDGRRYLLGTYRNTAGSTQAFAYAAALSPLGFDVAPGGIALANVVGDTNVDAIVSTRRDDKPALTIYPGNGAGGFGAPDPLPERYEAGDVVAADFDIDGKIDLVVIDRSHYAVVVYWHL